MENNYARTWTIILTAVGAAVIWVFGGGACFRRYFRPPASIAEASRTGGEFVAAAFPPLSARGGDYRMRQDDFEKILTGLRKAGCHAIGFKDIEDFYSRHRALPPKALLIALDRDNPDSVRLADEVLRRLRLRAAVFLKEEGFPKRGSRHALPAHTVSQLVKGGAWEVGWTTEQDPPEPPRGMESLPFLENEEAVPVSRDRLGYSLRFKIARSGYNDKRGTIADLRMLRVRPEKSAVENLALINGMFTRQDDFVDDFKSARLGTDWIVDWGLISAARRRMALIPLPQQTGAAVFINGTEGWRDAAVEFEIKRYAKDFWAHMRYSPERYIRIGVRDGFWYVQQKNGAGHLPVTLGRAPLLYGGWPARVRMVAKDDWLIVHINGKMQFGRALRLHPGVERGRVQFSVYAQAHQAAFAQLSYVRAHPLQERAIALKPYGVVGDEQFLERLREEAVFAAALCPRWISVAADGSVHVDGEEFEVVRALAGFYRCKLVPIVEPSARRGFTALSIAGLVRAAADLEADGLNVRVGPATHAEESFERFLTRLRKSLHRDGRQLWVTTGPESPSERLRTATDKFWVHHRPAAAGLGLLEIAANARSGL